MSSLLRLPNGCEHSSPLFSNQAVQILLHTSSLAIALNIASCLTLTLDKLHHWHYSLSTSVMRRWRGWAVSSQHSRLPSSVAVFLTHARPQHFHTINSIAYHLRLPVCDGHGIHLVTGIGYRSTLRRSSNTSLNATPYLRVKYQRN